MFCCCCDQCRLHACHACWTHGGLVGTLQLGGVLVAASVLELGPFRMCATFVRVWPQLMMTHRQWHAWKGNMRRAVSSDSDESYGGCRLEHAAQGSATANSHLVTDCPLGPYCSMNAAILHVGVFSCKSKNCCTNPGHVGRHCFCPCMHMAA